MKGDLNKWNTHIKYLHGKEIVCSLHVVNDIAERAVKLMEDFHGSLIKDDEKSMILLVMFKITEYYISIVTNI